MTGHGQNRKSRIAFIWGQDRLMPKLKPTGKKMSQLPMILELGVGSALRSGSYTKAACRAVRDALWRNSINLVEVFGADKTSMQIKAEIACQNPNAVDLNAVKAEFPYGNVAAVAVQGGLDMPNPNKRDQPGAIIAHAAIIVSLDVTKKGTTS
jgi:uncharacterized protein (TIGR02058 family)